MVFAIFPDADRLPGLSFYEPFEVIHAEDAGYRVVLSDFRLWSEISGHFHQQERQGCA